MNQSRPLNIVTHIIGWILFSSLIISFVFTSSGEREIFDEILSPYFLQFLFAYVLLFYCNTSLLIPKLYLRKKYFYYFAVIAVLFVAVYFFQPFDRLLSHNRELSPGPREMPPPFPGSHQPPKPRMHRPFIFPEREPRRRHTDIVSMILFVMVWSFSSALLIFKQWRLTEQRAARAEAEKANAELSFLKAQINPHFLFNTLNNIYAMSVTNHVNTPDSIMKLSQIMRYVTDEVSQELVPLQSETDCVSDYIALQQLRLNKKSSIEFSLTGNVDGKMIPPLILMPFIENVFKYGISNHESYTIIIKISSEDNAINFFCQNRIFNATKSTQRTGIGIANTRKRLQHHYPDKHVLNISNVNELYTVQLILPV